MTPNQIDGIAETVRQLLHDGHRQGLTPREKCLVVRLPSDGDAWIGTHWTEPEGTAATLITIVTPHGDAIPLPAVLSPDGVIPAAVEGYARRHASAQIPNLPTDCVVCGGLGCEHCPKVVGLA